MRLIQTSCIFPVPRPGETAAFYESLGFQAAEVRRGERPQIRLYRDQVELVLIQGSAVITMPNRALYGDGCDVYVYVDHPGKLEKEFQRRGAKLVRTLADTQNREFILEDIDGRWLSFGSKTPLKRSPRWYRIYSAAYLAALLLVFLLSVFLPGTRAVCLILCYLMLALELGIQLSLGKMTARAAALLLLLVLLFSYFRVL